METVQAKRSRGAETAHEDLLVQRWFRGRSLSGYKPIKPGRHRAGGRALLGSPVCDRCLRRR